MSFELDTKQKKVVAAGITTLAASIIAAAAIVLVVLMVRFFSAFDHVFLPLAVAAVAALVIEPWYEWLRDRARLPPVAALAATFVSIGLPLTAALTLFGALVVSQMSDLVEQVPQWFARLAAWAESHQPAISDAMGEHPLGVRIQESLQQPGGPIARGVHALLDTLLAAGGGAASAVVSIFGWAIVPVYIGFFLLMQKPDSDAVSARILPFFREATRDDVAYLGREFVNLVVSFFRGQLLIALLQGLLLAIGFSLVGLEYGIVLGLILGFLNVIPYLGSILGLGVCIPLAWFQTDGGLELVALVLAVFAFVQVVEGYFLTPKIMGDRTGLHPLAIIVAIFFWGSALDGIFGMILAIPLTAFLVVAWRLAREKYIREIF